MKILISTALVSALYIAQSQAIPGQFLQTPILYPGENTLQDIPPQAQKPQHDLVDVDKCIFEVDRGFYNLKDFANDQNGYQILDKNSKRIVYFNVCKNLDLTTYCHPFDPDMITMAVLWSEDTQKCIALTGSAEDNSLSITKSTVPDHITLEYSKTDKAPGFSLDMGCDKNSLFSNGVVRADDFNKIFGVFDSKAGCRVGELSAIWTWLETNRWPVFVIFVLIGFAVTFFGRAFFKPVLFLTGVFQASFVIMLICYSTFTKNNIEAWVGCVILVFSVLIGIAVGFIFIKYQLLGGFCLAAWGGFSVGLLIYNSFLYKVESDVALWVFSVGVGLIYGGMIFFFFDHVLIHATSIIGSFLVICGIGLVAGHYANPFTIAEMIHFGEIKDIDPLFYAYLAGNVVLYVIGCVWQYHRLRQHKELTKALKGSTASLGVGTEVRTKVNETGGNQNASQTME